MFTSRFACGAKYFVSPPFKPLSIPIPLSVRLSRCHGTPRFIFGIPWATKTRCQRSSCRHALPGPFHAETATLASGGPRPDPSDPLDGALDTRNWCATARCKPHELGKILTRRHVVWLLICACSVFNRLVVNGLYSIWDNYRTMLCMSEDHNFSGVPYCLGPD